MTLRELKRLANEVIGAGACVDEWRHHMTHRSTIEACGDSLHGVDITIRGGTKAQRRRALAAALKEMGR